MTLPFLKGGNGIRSLYHAAAAASLGSAALTSSRIFHDFLVPFLPAGIRVAASKAQVDWATATEHRASAYPNSEAISQTMGALNSGSLSFFSEIAYATYRVLSIIRHAQPRTPDG